MADAGDPLRPLRAAIAAHLEGSPRAPAESRRLAFWLGQAEAAARHEPDAATRDSRGRELAGLREQLAGASREKLATAGEGLVLARIEGRVSAAATGAGVQYAVIDVYDQAGDYAGMAVSGPNGSYFVPSLVPGTYYLTAFNQDDSHPANLAAELWSGHPLPAFPLRSDHRHADHPGRGADLHRRLPSPEFRPGRRHGARRRKRPAAGRRPGEPFRRAQRIVRLGLHRRERTVLGRRHSRRPLLRRGRRFRRPPRPHLSGRALPHRGLRLLPRLQRGGRHRRHRGRRPDPLRHRFRHPARRHRRRPDHRRRQRRGSRGRLRPPRGDRHLSSFETTTDADGRYFFPGRKAGTWRLQASAGGYTPRPTTATPASTSTSARPRPSTR